jgi:glycosyltransferase involved in cell wall biosynthesis
MMTSHCPSIGIFLARPDRTFYMAQKLRQRGFSVVHYNTVGYGRDSYVRISRRQIAALAHLLLRTNHDIYFTSIGFVPVFDLYLNRLLRGKPYVYNATGVKWAFFADRAKGRLFSSFFERTLYPFLLNRTFGGASRIICNSHFLESTLAQHYPQYQDRLLTIYNGIDFERYSSGRRGTIPGVSENDTVLLCVTALNFANKSKGIGLVMDAFGQVHAHRKAVKLVIAAKSSNPRQQRWAEEYLRSKPWKDSVVLVYNREDIPDLLASSDVFVYATPADSNDSLPRALLEAQAAGLPVVTTDTSGCPEIVRNGKTGFVVPYKTEALAEKIVQLIDSPQLLRTWGKAAQQWVAQTFNWDQMADQYAKVFRELA